MKPKLDEASSRKPCEVNNTEIVMSVDRRKTGPFRKSFRKLNIDWPLIGNQRREWNKLSKTSKDSNRITHMLASQQEGAPQPISKKTYKLKLETGPFLPEGCVQERLSL